MIVRCFLAMFLAALALGSQACSTSRHSTRVVVVEQSTHRGPPPHAPAHGYRHKHREGVDLIFDAHRGVYVVAGHPACYWQDDHYYRDRGSRWEVSVSIQGPWRITATSSLPSGLMAENGKKEKGKKKP
jgi:hypothetical protein